MIDRVRMFVSCSAEQSINILTRSKILPENIGFAAGDHPCCGPTRRRREIESSIVTLRWAGRAYDLSKCTDLPKVHRKPLNQICKPTFPMGNKKGLSEGRLFGLRRGTTRRRERAEASEQSNCRELSSRKACHKSSFKEIGETTWEFCGWGSTTTIMKNIDKALHRDTVLIVKHTAQIMGRMLDNQHGISM